MVIIGESGGGWGWGEWYGDEKNKRGMWGNWSGLKGRRGMGGEEK